MTSTAYPLNSETIELNNILFFWFLQDYEVDLYLRQGWQDDRFKKNTFSRALDLNDPKLVQRIWKPEVSYSDGRIF